MKKIIVLFLVVITSLSIANKAKKYGSEITLTEKTEISQILKDPESYDGKKVLVEGTVIGVCAKRGCWINLGGDDESEIIRVKVKDGEIVFPMEAKGKKALVEGEVFSIITESEGCGNDCEGEHKESEHSKENCEHKKTQKKIFMIKGLGAVIK